MTPIAFASPGNETMTAALCQARGWEQGRWVVRAFPDGETHVRFLSDVRARELVLVCGLERPDEKALRLYLAASVARELGAARIGLVAPYLSYMRQDKRFNPGEGVTARHFASLLSAAVDWLVTVDPHLHRIRDLGQIYRIPARAVAAAPGIARWISANVAQPLLVGPDAESEQWVAGVAAAAGCPYLILSKERLGDREVSVSAPELARGQARTPVLVDDIASTGKTLAAAMERLREAGLAAPVCVVVHPLFVGAAYDELLAAGARAVVSTNTIAHFSNRIDVGEAIGAAADSLMAEQGVPS